MPLVLFWFIRLVKFSLTVFRSSVHLESRCLILFEYLFIVLIIILFLASNNLFVVVSCWWAIRSSIVVDIFTQASSIFSSKSTKMTYENTTSSDYPMYKMTTDLTKVNTNQAIWKNRKRAFMNLLVIQLHGPGNNFPNLINRNLLPEHNLYLSKRLVDIRLKGFNSADVISSKSPWSSTEGLWIYFSISKSIWLTLMFIFSLAFSRSRSLW